LFQVTDNQIKYLVYYTVPFTQNVIKIHKTAAG